MKILLTTHGTFAEGILESYRMIAGETNSIHSISLNDDGIGEFRKRLLHWLDQHNQEDILILCDLRGGTPFNECFAYYLSHPHRIRLITGLNLPMLIESALQLPAKLSLDEYASIAYSTGKNEIILAVDEKEEEINF